MRRMVHQTIELQTDDGRCPAHIFHSDGDGPWPGVIFFMDGVGMRPAMTAMAERLAAAGYYVLLPDLFYRAGAYQPPDPAKLFADPAVRADWFKRIASSTSAALMARDTHTFLAHLDGDPRVRGPRFGATGYCMGGRMALTAAASHPDRFAAVAAFHPGGVVTDAPDSLHLVAPKIRARVLVAGASEDQTFTDEHKRLLDEAFTAGGVPHLVETWPARHGWVPPDMPVHDAAQAERHWTALRALFAETLAA
jgi:carboxymethylenebutenolidase